MKLRQKLAVVLASAMVVTAVPVVTMAASTNSLTKETLKVQKNKVTTANALKIDFKDNDGEAEVFYLELTNAKWSDSDIDAFNAQNSNIQYDKQNDTTVKVTIEENALPADKVERFPILAEVTGGDATVSVVTMGGSTTVSKGSYVFATTAEKKMSVKVGDAKTFYTSGSLADITIEEAFKGALSEEGGTFTIELDDADFEFDSSYSRDEKNPTTLSSNNVEFKYGFYSVSADIKVYVDKDDEGKLYVIVPAMAGNTTGQIILKNLDVKSTNKKPEQGDLLADIKSVNDSLTADVKDAKVAKISEYGIFLKMNDDKVVDIKGGRIEEIKFQIGENVEDSMITNREFEITLDNAHFDYKGLYEDAKKDGKVKSNSETDVKKQAKYIEKEWLANKILDNKDDWKNCEAEFDVNSDGEIIPETIIFTIGNAKKDNAFTLSTQANGQCDTLKFVTKACVSIENKDKEKATLKVSGRGIENDAEVTAINIINPFNVTFEQAVLKTGLQGQVAGSVTLTETDKDMFQKGDVEFKITKDNEEFDIYLTDAKVEVSAGLKGTKSKVNKGKATTAAAIELDLNRVSKEAATITFKDLTFTTSRTVPEGTYDLEISGKAIDADDHTLKIKDFIKISTANTQDITANGLAKGVASFVIGENKYTLNGQTVEMDAASYIQDPGYTMVSVRYVANAFGVSPSDIMFGKGTVTIFAGERTISLTSGSDVALVNGNPVQMATAVVNKEGRTYVPAGQLASLLGIKSTWDSATKTATFENK